MQMALPPYGKFKHATTAKIKKFALQSSQENEQLQYGNLFHEVPKKMNSSNQVCSMEFPRKGRVKRR
jgi:hypothetical protein